MQKFHYIKLTEDEMDLLSIMLEQESGTASNLSRYATSETGDYGYKDELKSLWKKVYTNGVPFPYKLTANYEKS